jgi:K+-transporting ATPase ATPase B chain
MSTRNKKQSQLFTIKLLVPALNSSFMKLNPIKLIKTPIIFIVELGAILTTGIVIKGLFAGEFCYFCRSHC